MLSNDDFNIERFDIFPNPINNQLHIKFNSRIESIEIYDIQGKIIQELEKNSENVTIDMSEYESGVYFLKIITDKGMLTKKILKK